MLSNSCYSSNNVICCLFDQSNFTEDSEVSGLNTDPLESWHHSADEDEPEKVINLYVKLVYLENSRPSTYSSPKPFKHFLSLNTVSYIQHLKELFLLLSFKPHGGSC